MNSPVEANPCHPCHTCPTICPALAHDLEGVPPCVEVDENRFVTADGRVYVAVPALEIWEPHSCDICQHPVKYNCVDSCIPEFRADHRNIVWKLETEAKETMKEVVV